MFCYEPEVIVAEILLVCSVLSLGASLFVEDLSDDTAWHLQIVGLAMLSGGVCLLVFT